MGFDYTRPRQTADRLIKRFGQPGTLRKTANTGPEWAPVQKTTDTTITVVDLDERLRDASGTLVGKTQRTIYISTEAGVTPAKGDKVFVGLDKDAVAGLSETEQSAASHEIDELRRLAPGGQAVLFEADLIS